MYLKRDDIDALLVLLEQGYMRADQFAEIRYTHIDNPLTRLRMGQRRVKELAEKGFLRRIELPVYKSERRGSVPFVYAVGAKAVPHIADRLGVAPQAVSYQPKPSFERKLIASPWHTLQITDYYLALKRSCEESNTDLLVWKGETALNRMPLKVTIPTDKGKQETAQFCADAYYELGTDKDQAYLFLEHDRATEPITSKRRRTHWRRKIRCYLALHESGQLSGALDVDRLWVTIVTTAGKGRVESIKCQAEEIAGPDNHSFWITTFDNICAIRPGTDEPLAVNVLQAPIWHVSGQNGVHAMLQQVPAKTAAI